MPNDDLPVGVWRFCHSDLCNPEAGENYDAIHEISLSDLSPLAKALLEAAMAYGKDPFSGEHDLQHHARLFAASARGAQ